MTSPRKPARPELHGDFILRMLQGLVNGVEGITFPVTVHSGGIIVTGDMISSSLYYKLLAKEFETNIPQRVENIGKFVVDFFTKQHEILKASHGEGGPVLSLHLRDAFFIQRNESGDFIPDGGEGMLWRGPLDSVDGFFFGRFLPPKSSQPELPFPPNAGTSTAAAEAMPKPPTGPKKKAK